MSPTCCAESTATGYVRSSGGPWPVWRVSIPEPDGSVLVVTVRSCPFCGRALGEPPDEEAVK